MNIQKAINLAYQTALGAPRELAPGSSRYERMLAIANMAAMQWESEPDVLWGSLCQTVNVGTARAAGDYELPEDVRTVDVRQFVTIEKDSQAWTFPFISPQLLRQGCYGVAVFGWRLQFNGITEQMQGGAVKVPVVMRLEPMKRPGDKVMVDDPNWLVYMMAAEFVRNSRTKQNQYSNLIAMAQSAMEGMKSRNMHHLQEVQYEDVGL